MKYGKIRQPSPRRTSRREEDYQQVQALLDSGDQALWKALYEDAYETVRQCAAYTDFGHLLDPEEYREIAVSGAQPLLRLGRRIQQEHYPHPLQPDPDGNAVSASDL